ncbi:Fungal transcriptional regulatory protein, N-terminal [Penicillium camemberti]|uniref:Fungal transcriptional regulatory protein, N-terminal n=1 Tax=Penicillium camemberti (strain FM 013) TaxID=1429867 RepID=A0A0G4P1A0_PENC3|nr:Fungal transcriptional regulatory protein, N-terminal [Penicillium camemberti]
MPTADPTMLPYLSVFKSPNPRAKQVCQQCRARKVGCDGRLSTCRNCERLGFQCSFTPPDESLRVAGARSGPSTDERPERLRGRSSCSQCRVRKVRCSNTHPQCANCIKYNRPCSYPASTVAQRRDRNSGGHGEHGEEDLPSAPLPGSRGPDAAVPANASMSVGYGSLPPDLHKESAQGDPSHSEATELVRNFFEYLYPVPSYAFLHPSTTLAKCNGGTLERPLVLAICALTSLHGPVHNMDVDRETSAIWVSNAEETIWKCLENPSMPRLQALLLTISYRMATGSYEKAFMLTAIAARAASAMGLNHEQTHLDPILEETRRRTVWCFKLLESYFSIGLTEFEVCPFECIYLHPPSSEESFGLLCPPGSEDFAIYALRDQNELGSLNMCIRLASIRRDIMKLTRELAVCSEPYLHLNDVTAGLEEILCELKAEMPNRAGLTTTGLKNLIETPWLPRHIMMVSLWHGCYFDLYRIFLPGYPEAPPSVVLSTIDAQFIHIATRTCIEHALSVINLFCDLNQSCTKPRLLEFATGVCVYHAIRLILFIAHSSTEPDLLSLEFAVSRAELCLAAMKRFFHGLALVQPILDDIAQLIEIFSSSNSATETLSVFHKVNHGRKSDTRILSAARPRQHLAVHSVLQQAKFLTEEPPS